MQSVQSKPEIRLPRRAAVVLAATTALATSALATSAFAQTTVVLPADSASLLDSSAYTSVTRALGLGPAVADAPSLPGQLPGTGGGGSSVEVAIGTAILGGEANGPGIPVLEIETSGETPDGLRRVRLHQTVGGVRVWGTDVKATIRDGRVAHTVSRTVSPLLQPAPSTLSESEAIAAAVAEHHGGAAEAPGYWHVAPTATPVLIPTGPSTLESGWEVVTWSEADNRLHHTAVDGQGRVLASELRTSNDRYRVYTKDPSRGDQVLQNGPGSAGNAESPDGWINPDATQYNVLIQGNNAAAYLDTSNSNTPDGAGAVVITDEDFTSVHQPSSDPSVQANKEAAVQTLFWTNNRIHDDLYRHGFVEATGNFQNDNFGRGGAGGDSVYAEAQDGSGTNNANFATPDDGSHPRMQMYVWTQTSPYRDSALDGDVIWHEYGHGLTWRMIGNMSGAVSGAIGEGMSDALAILHLGTDAVGEYSVDRPEGIRSERYGSYSRTIGDFTGSSVHFDGEIYAATIHIAGWLYRSSGLNNEDLMDWLVDGMNYTPSRPTYLDMRDGILAAAPAGLEQCNIWRAFARYGMGTEASFTVSGSSVSIGESKSIPSECNSGVNIRAFRATPSLNSNGTWNIQGRVTAGGGNRVGAKISVFLQGGRKAECTTNSNGVCWVNFRGIPSRHNKRWIRVGQANDLIVYGKQRFRSVSKPAE